MKIKLFVGQEVPRSADSINRNRVYIHPVGIDYIKNNNVIHIIQIHGYGQATNHNRYVRFQLPYDDGINLIKNILF